MRRIGTGLAASGLIARTMMPKIIQPDGEKRGNPAMDMLNDLLLFHGPEHSAAEPQNNIQPGNPAIDLDLRFQQTMNMLYSSLGLDGLAGVSPYRQAGWEEKYLEQKENSADITTAAPALEPKAPAPEPAYKQEFQMNFGLSML